MRWLTIAASMAIACAPAALAGKSAGAAQTAQAGTSAPPSPSPQPKRPTHKHKHYVKHQAGQKAPTPDRISEIQSALAREGYYKGELNGKFDSNTVAALQKFQSDNGLDADGKLDAPTLQKLGLGSDIAGVAAPKAVVPSCCSAAPSGTAPTGDKPAPSCCSMPTGQQSQPAPLTPPTNSGAGSSGPTSSDPKPTQP